MLVLLFVTEVSFAIYGQVLFLFLVLLIMVNLRKCYYYDEIYLSANLKML